jgi:hypothetical protein
MRWAVVLLLLGCADDNLAGVGEPCSSSGDCAAGLICAFTTKTNHTCQPAGPPRPDLSALDDLSMPGMDSSISD